ncbi:MAG: glycosyltransferase [Desulfobulbaceae bacterium]|nr:glycosyltransferase [Desulfobulbaceae bacterium]
MKTTIAFVINAFPQPSETFIANQITALIQTGRSIDILANELLDIGNSSQTDLLARYDLMKATSVFPETPSNFYQRLTRALQILRDSTPVKRFALLKSLNVFTYRRAALNLDAFYQGARFVRHGDYPLYHAQYGPNGRAAAIAKELGLIRGKIITTFHGYDAHCRLGQVASLVKFYRPLFTHGDLFTANTDYLAAQLCRIGCPEDKIRVVPMGIDTSFFHPSVQNLRRPTDPIRLLSVGRLVGWKGHHLGIKAVTDILSTNQEVHYTIIGDGPEKSNLQILIDKYGIDNQVTLVGMKNQEEVRNYMQNSDIFLMTSTHDDHGRRETQGMVSAEAQACGLPVVAFLSGGIGSTIRHDLTGLLVEENDTSGFTKAIIDLIDNPLRRKTMGRAGVDFIKKNYSLDVTARAINELYCNLLEN